jgi:hypothetical protein
VLGSVAFHALLVALFVLDLTGKPIATPPPAMTVFLERAPAPPRSGPSSRGGPKARSAAPKADVSPATPIAIPAAPASPSAPEGVPVAPAPDLRGLGGCRLATLDRLPADERARCQERLAQAMGDGRAPRPNFDPTGRYVRDAKPYLTRPPHNGCKPVAAVKNEVTGQTSATIGIGCAWSF